MILSINPVLEFQNLLQLIADYSHSSSGKEKILAIRASSDLQWIKAEQLRYKDFISILEADYSFPSRNFECLRDIFKRASPEDAVLSAKDLLLCQKQLLIVDDMLKFFRQPEIRLLPSIQKLLIQLSSCADFQRSLQACLEDDGKIKDTASAELHSIRKKIFTLERRLQKTFDDILKSSAYNEVIQEKFITLRNGRYVIPVKKDARSQLPGLVHDYSNSGQTIFLEPEAAVALGNELAILRLQERDEIRKILFQLSCMLRNNLPQLRENQELLTLIDVAAAIAIWSKDYDCLIPAFAPYLSLSAARHPLLLAQFRKEAAGRRVVPLDLELPRGKNVLVITGSNTGGKTVALKTTGILVLAAQSGLPVPVEENSKFTVFEAVFADIGDEQSLQENLSTFSAHISNIVKILSSLKQGRALVLLDELGSGTDPLEGGALACAILQELSRTAAMTLATTHLGMVKNFVQTQRKMLNAAVRFNIETLEPEYILDIGRPGASHALHIAERLKFPAKILQNAEQMLSGEQLRLEKTLTKLESEQIRLSSSSDEVEKIRDELQENKDTLKKELTELKKERKKLMNDAYAQANALVNNTQREMDRMLAALKRKASKSMSDKDRAELQEFAADISTKLAKKTKNYQEGRRRTAALPSTPLADKDIKKGTLVWVEKLKSHARIEDVFSGKEKVLVSMGDLTVTVSCSDLQQARIKETKQEKPKVKVSLPRFTGETKHEINLLGYTVEDAIAELDAYLNDCVLARLTEVRIVHGFGSGRLRTGVHNWLKKHSLVKEFRLGKDHQDPGAAGVTIVTLTHQ